jgi:tryptophan synthase alpha chain
LAQIAASATGFVYAVSVTGTTGERGADATAPAEVVARARAGAGGDIPIALGFGISTPEQAAAAARAGADGVIVGTRLVRAAGNGADGPRQVGELTRALSAALSSS